jgi:hypothetical protein
MIAARDLDETVFCDFDDFDSLPDGVRQRVAVTDDELRELADFAFVSGHFSLRTLESLTSPDAIATVIREPRARLLSLFAYWRVTDFSAMDPYRAHEYARGTLQDLLAEPLAAAAVDNQLCRLVLHPDPRLPPVGFIANGDVGELAADTLGRLDELGFVGLQEHPRETWPGLERVFGIRLPRMRENVTAATVRIPPPPMEGFITGTTLALLDARSAVDTIVYREILARSVDDEAAAEQLATVAFARQLVTLGDVVGNTAHTRGEQLAALEADLNHVRSATRHA